MRLERTLAAVAIVVCAAACARRPAPDAAPRAAIELTGRVEIVGNEPVPELVLVGGDGTAARLLGALAGELRALQNATVRVSGQRTSDPPGGGFLVEQYEVLSIDGERPAVGVLMNRNGRLMLVGAEEVEVVGAPEQLARGIGATVWVVGPRSGGAIHVRSFGVIRAP